MDLNNKRIDEDLFCSFVEKNPVSTKRVYVDVNPMMASEIIEFMNLCHWFLFS